MALDEISAYQRSNLRRRMILESVESCLEGSAFPPPLCLKLFTHLESVVGEEAAVAAGEILTSEDESDEEFLGADKPLEELQHLTQAEKETVKALVTQKLTHHIKLILKLKKKISKKTKLNEDPEVLDERVEALQERVMASNAELNKLSEMIDQTLNLGNSNTIYSMTYDALLSQFKKLNSQLKTWRSSLEGELFSTEGLMAMDALEGILSTRVSTLEDDVDEKKKRLDEFTECETDEYKAVVKELKAVDEAIKKKEWVLQELSEY